MRAVILKSFDARPLTVEKRPLPNLEHGHVLVRMAAAPINPSDLVFLKDLYGVHKPLPVVPGFEGSGTVVAARGGLYAHWLVGKRVACRAGSGDGTWAEFMATGSDAVVPLLKSVTLEQGAMLLVNPLTAWAFVTIAQESGCRAFVQTAAASAVGQMIDRLARHSYLTVINVVRRPEQAEMLRAGGATAILDSSTPQFDEDLRTLCQKHQATLVFDGVGGELTGRIAAAMPKGSRAVVYGALSGDACALDPRSLIFAGQRVEGFWLPVWFGSRSWAKKLAIVTGAQKLLTSDLATKIQARFPLEKINEAIALYKERRSEGKVLLVP
jgi:NADPH:quinone reductase